MADYSVVSKQNFKVEIDDIDFGNFSQVSGLGGTAEVMDDIGGMDFNARNVVSKVKFNPVTITRNCDPTDKRLKQWWQTVVNGKPSKKSVSVVIYASDGVTEVDRNDLFDCVPSAWNISDLNSSESGTLTETLTFVYERAGE